MKQFVFNRYHLVNYHHESKLPIPTTKREGDSTQMTLADCGNLKISATKAASLATATATWIAKSCRPIAICEDEGFINLMRAATGNMMYSPPSRTTIQRRVDTMFNDCKSGIQKDLKETAHVALTCDYWSSVSNVSFLGMTVHYVDNNFNLISKALAVDESTERHTTENVRAEIESVIQDFKLDGKVVAVVTDNAANMIAAMRTSNIVGVGCAAHSLQIAVKKALTASNTTEVLAKTRRIVGHVKHSPANYRELKELMKEKGEPEEALVIKYFTNTFYLNIDNII